MKDLTIDRFKDAVLQNAGGLLVIIPSNLSQLSDTEKEVYACRFWHVEPDCYIWLFIAWLYLFAISDLMSCLYLPVWY